MAPPFFFVPSVTFCFHVFPFFLSFFLFPSRLAPWFLCFCLSFITYSQFLPFFCLYPSVFLSFSRLSIVLFLQFLFTLSYVPFNDLLIISYFLSSLLYVSHFLHSICFRSLTLNFFFTFSFEGPSVLWCTAVLCISWRFGRFSAFIFRVNQSVDRVVHSSMPASLCNWRH